MIGGDTGHIGEQLALVAAVAAAIQIFLAPTIHAQVEALQASGLVPARHGEIAANVLGVVYGLCLGALGMLATGVNDWVLLVVGFVAGLVAGGGAVIADQRNDGLMARKLEQAAVTEPPVLTAGEGVERLERGAPAPHGGTQPAHRAGEPAAAA